MKTFSILISFVFFYLGCSSSNLVKHDDKGYTELNRKLSNKRAKITLHNGDIIDGINIKVGLDSCSWSEVEKKRAQGSHRRFWYEKHKWSVPAQEVREISRKNHLRGAFEGLGVGALSGSAIGAFIGLITFSPPPQDAIFYFGPRTAKESALVGGVVFGFIGGVAGLVKGVVTGHKNTYILNAPAQSDKNIVAERDLRYEKAGASASGAVKR